MAKNTLIDLNADLGEDCGDDTAMLDLVTTANVACGGHAGGGQTMRDTIAAAVTRGVDVGAHPSYPDQPDFGRISRFDQTPYIELYRSLTNQITDAGLELAEHGQILSHVKPHGALYNDANERPDVADLVLTSTIKAAINLGYNRFIPLMTMPGSVLAALAARMGYPVILEGFIDRLYTPDGLLTPRSTPGAVLHDVDAIVTQALELATGHVTASDGTRIPMPVTTLCVHGDTPDAVTFARAARTALTAAGYTITKEVHA